MGCGERIGSLRILAGCSAGIAVAGAALAAACAFDLAPIGTLNDAASAGDARDGASLPDSSGDGPTDARRLLPGLLALYELDEGEIGRASCRERVYVLV